MPNILKKSLKFGEKFCLYPFIHYHLNTKKERQLCCQSEHSVTDARLAEIRNLVLENKGVNECTSCYQIEEKKQISRRQMALKDFAASGSKIEKNIQTHLDGKTPEPFYYDLRYSNLCNLECQMCHPRDSSAIAIRQNQEVKFLSWEPEFNISNDAERVYLAGGEPFLIKSFSRALSTIKNTNCEIVVNTNATIITDHLLTELDRFKNVSFYVSLDGYNEINSLIRKNSIWNDIVDNIAALAKRYGGYKQINVNTVVQKDNVNHLLELGVWLDSLNINTWKLTLCKYPDNLHYSNTKINFQNDLFNLSLVKQNINNSKILTEIKNAAS